MVGWGKCFSLKLRVQNVAVGPIDEKDSSSEPAVRDNCSFILVSPTPPMGHVPHADRGEEYAKVKPRTGGKHVDRNPAWRRAPPGRTLLVMPKGPRGERRPADVVGCTVNVARVATGEIGASRRAQPAKQKNGLAGAKIRADALPKGGRSTVEELAAGARWSDDS